MVRMSQRKGIAAVVLLSLMMPLAGCVNTGVGSVVNSDQTASPPGNTSDPTGLTPAGSLTPDLNVKQARFTSPTTTGDKPSDKPAMLGMPTPVMMAQVPLPLPTEKGMISHPPHRVAPPDILVIEALRLVPRGPYKLEPMEVLQVEVTGAFKDAIKGLYMISPEGTINLGHTLLPIPVGGLTVDRAQLAITEYIRKVVKTDFNVAVTLVQMRGMQNVKGEHLVRPDGTISLGMYGSVYVAGMTLGQVKCTIENHLAAYLVSPQISVDVLAYNSRKIYIIADGAGYGQQVIALPATGNETVLDAISRVQGLPPVASLKKIWVARPAPAGHPCSQILPVSWQAIVQGGDTATNYQLLPGDRIYISSDPLIRAYNYLDKMIAPVERVLGVMLLGSSTVNSFRGTTNSGFIIAP